MVAEPVRGSVDAREQAAQRGLARAARPDDGQPLAHAQAAGRRRGARRARRGRRSAGPRRPGRPPRAAGRRRSIGLHLGDAEEAARRRGTDLEPVDLADQPVEGVGQRLDVQDRCGDLAEVDPATAVGVGADQQGDHTRRPEREVERDEQDVAQRHRVALGLRRDLDVVVARAHPHTGQAQRLQGASALDGLGERGVDAGVRRALGDVGLRCTAQVAAHGPRRRGEGEQRRHREDDGVEQHRADRQEHGEQRDDRHRQAVLDRPAHGADVAGDPGDEVAGAGALDGAERQPQDGAHDVLAGGREQVLAEERRGALGGEREPRLGSTTADDQPARACRAAARRRRPWC